jgi:predicted Ser/Thr protein kinase
MPSKCPQCGAVLPAGALEGLCPACLLKLGMGTRLTTASAPFQPPSVEEVARLFPQLEILAFIGKGGMGAVYKARQPALDRLVALKILPPQAAGGPGFAERFTREARALARLSHPNIVAVHEFGQAGGSPFFIMEFVDGLTLRQLEQAARLPSAEALRIVPQICEALQFAHDEGIVHRDIKPENILIDKKGRVKIADFGIAKILGGAEAGQAVTETRQAVGTPQYMAPEQWEKPQTVDHRADIFSLGVVFYEMLTGQLPVGRFAPPSRKVEIDARLDEVVLRALEHEPELRYQRAAEVKTQIDTIASSPRGAPQATPTLDARQIGEQTRPRVSQSASSPTGSVHAAQRILYWLSLGFFGVGLLAWPVLWAIDANKEVALVCILSPLALALILGLMAWPARVRWVVLVVMLGLLARGVVVRFIAAANHAGLNSNLLLMVILVVLFASGVIASAVTSWLERRRPKVKPPPPTSPPAGTETARVFAWLALGCFLAALLSWPLLMLVDPTHAAPLTVAGVGLFLALVFGIIGWRERLGRVVAIVVFGLLALGGGGVLIALLYRTPTSQAERTKQAEADDPAANYRRVRQRLAALENFESSLESHYTTNNNLVKTNLIQIEETRAEMNRLEKGDPGLRAEYPGEKSISVLSDGGATAGGSPDGTPHTSTPTGTSATGDFVEYPVNKTWAELGDMFDLSSPEKAAASFSIRLAGGSDLATLLNEAAIGFPPIPVGSLNLKITEKPGADLLKNTVVEVVLYREDLAGVISFNDFTNQLSTDQFSTGCLARRNTEWKVCLNQTLKPTLTKEAAIRQFKNKAEQIRQEMDGLANQPPPSVASQAAELSNGIVQISGALGQAMKQFQQAMSDQVPQQFLSATQFLPAPRLGNSSGDGAISIGSPFGGPPTTVHWSQNGTNIAVETNR